MYTRYLKSNTPVYSHSAEFNDCYCQYTLFMMIGTLNLEAGKMSLLTEDELKKLNDEIYETSDLLSTSLRDKPSFGTVIAGQTNRDFFQSLQLYILSGWLMNRKN